MNAQFQKAAEMITAAKSIFVLSGAGVSAESGVPTFRDSNGFWEGHAIEDVATPEGWRRNPQLVWDFYNARRATAASVKPNPGHFALAELEKKFPNRFTIATQNVDGLHQSAGTVNVLELHGSLRRTRCTSCGDIRDQGIEALPKMPKCSCGQVLRPDIVWFNEMLPQDIWRKAERAAREADVALVVGTSAVVYPATGLIAVAQQTTPYAKVIEFNLNETDASACADISLFGPSGISLPEVIKLLP